MLRFQLLLLSIRIQDAKCSFHLQHVSGTVDNATLKEMRETKIET